MKRKLCTLLALIALLNCFALTAPAEEGITVMPLAEGCVPVEVLAAVATYAIMEGQALDQSSVAMTDSALTADCGIFTIRVDYSGSYASGITISSAYLDAEYARTMGVIFGKVCAGYGGFDDADQLLVGLDFNAFNSLTMSSQTLVQGDYKIVLRVAPDDPRPYQLTLALLKPLSEPAVLLDASGILKAMDPDLSASFAFTAGNDPNGRLGREGEYTSKVNFGLTSVDPKAVSDVSLLVSSGGSIEVFGSTGDAISRASYVSGVQLQVNGKQEIVIAYGCAVLRLSPDLDAEEAGLLIGRFIAAVRGGAAPQQAAAPAATPAPTPGPTATPAPAISLKAGDIVTFGRYEQDNVPANGREPIEWIVLKTEDDRVMLVSRYVLDVYNTYWGSPTWDKSTLRTWMNGTFLNTAFSEQEQKALVTVTVTADKNPNYSSDPGADTQDKVYCLSYVEANTLLTNSQRRTAPTDYARVTGKVYVESNGCCYWWLRSPGRPKCGAAIVCADGSYDYDASYDGFCYGVRPVIWVDLTQFN